MNKRHVSVSGVRLKFASAHMATLGNELEPLHGHNLWVRDFSKIKGITRDICDQLDHKFLLQAKSNLLSSTLEQETWHLSFDNRVYQLPQSDVAVLAIENTTAELLAEWICHQIDKELLHNKQANITLITVEVEEMPGQSGGFQLERSLIED
jgi:6-pyruvoyl-tetrahydropterin synthase